MSDWLIYSIGFLAQILFSSRLLIQWIQSEKVKKVVTPLLFWQLSLLASFLLFVYGWFRNDFAIMLGQVLTYFIYIRNLQIQGFWKKLHKFFRVFLFFGSPLFFSSRNHFYSSLCISMDLFRKEKRINFTNGFLGFKYQWFTAYYNICHFKKRSGIIYRAYFWQFCLFPKYLIDQKT